MFLILVFILLLVKVNNFRFLFACISVLHLGIAYRVACRDGMDWLKCLPIMILLGMIAFMSLINF